MLRSCMPLITATLREQIEDAGDGRRYCRSSTISHDRHGDCLPSLAHWNPRRPLTTSEGAAATGPQSSLAADENRSRRTRRRCARATGAACHSELDLRPNPPNGGSEYVTGRLRPVTGRARVVDPNCGAGTLPARRAIHTTGRPEYPVVTGSIAARLVLFGSDQTGRPQLHRERRTRRRSNAPASSLVSPSAIETSGELVAPRRCRVCSTNRVAEPLTRFVVE